MPRREDERPDTDRQRIVCRVTEIARVRECMFRQDRRRGRTRREEARQKRTERFLQMKDDRVRIGLVHLRHKLEADSRRHGIVRIVHLVRREDHVVGRERLSVGPRHAVPQLDPDRRPRGVDVAVALRRDLGSELRGRLIGAIVAEEPRHRELAEICRVDLLVEHRVESADVFAIGEAQDVRLSRHVDTTTMRRVDARAATCAERHQEQCRERAPHALRCPRSSYRRRARLDLAESR